MNDNDKRNLCTGCGLMPQKPVSPKPPVCGCKKKKCCKKDCCKNDFVFRKVVIPAALGDDVTGKAKPSNGAYTNSYVEYEAGGAQYMYDSYGVYTKIEPGSEGTLDFNELENRPRYAGIEMTGETDIPDFSDSITALQGSIADEQEARIAADSGLQTQIDALSAASDVTDIVGTYAELEAYDTSKLKDNDIIKVLQDETHDDETTYYRWVKATSSFSLIGEEGPYYTKAAADQKFQDKLTAGDGVTIDSDNVISADGETIFYANLNETGTTRHIYKDIDFTSAVSAQDIIDANDKGQVILRGTSLVNPTAYNDSYLQNAFIMPHNNDYEFVFLDRDLRYEYTASATTDTDFYYDTSEIQPKLTAGSNVQITGTTISATDTTYSNFTGTDGVDAGTAGLVPAPAVSDAGKYLKSDGTWDSVQAGPTVVQTTGTSTTDVMSQIATSQLVYPSGSETSKTRISIGPNHTIAANNIVAIGDSVTVRSNEGIGIGKSAYIASAQGGIAIGQRTSAAGSGAIAIGGGPTSYYTTAGGSNSVALGSGSYTVRANTISIGRGDQSAAGGPATRFIANVTDPTLAQDAATKNYTDNLAISYAALNGSAAPTTATEGKYVGQLYYDTTNEDMYFLKAITPQGTTPETYEYTWEAIGGGGGIPTNTTFWGQTVSNGAVNGLMTFNASSQGYDDIMTWTGPRNNKVSVRVLDTSAGGGFIGFAFNVGSGTVLNILNNKVGIMKEMVLNGQNITELGDPINARDAANKRYVDNRVLTNAGAPTTSTVGTVGQILEDTTNGKLYICTDATNPYVWEEVGGGGIQNALIIREWS